MGSDIKKLQTDNGKGFTNSESEKKTLFELKLDEKGIEYGFVHIYHGRMGKWKEAIGLIASTTQARNLKVKKNC
ncbi:hypothetical protein [Leptotrichia sp. oral taxon 879]|uniref:Integrase catalytic domain-containing protein n=1 Tax=Leptotrichia mesophila TaxID=3239303 RepID=A0AB39VDL6_9FUSO|nr:hypothetical protein [Leptotrichia sp. oral taxon 879]